jgi:hypothetical protein
MSVVRSSGLFVALIVLVAVLTGCGGTPGAGGSVNAGAKQPGASQPGGGASTPVDNPPTVDNPPIVDGAFTSGNMHAEISGDVNTTLDFPLQGGMSITTGGSTVLSYADPATGNGGGVIISPEVNGITIASTQVSLGGSNADANICTIVVTRSDAAGLAGTFDCKRILGVVVDAAAGKNVTVDVRGTFEARR